MAKKKAAKKRAPPKPKYVSREATLNNLLSEPYGEFATLGEELRNWYDNMSENLQGSRDDVDGAASEMEGIEEPGGDDIPKEIAELVVKFNSTPVRRRESRADRRDRAVQELDVMIQFLEDFEEQCDKREPLDRDPALRELTDARLNELKEEIKTLREKLEEDKDTAEAVDFPGRNA